MTMSLPTKEQIEDYISSAEEFLSSSLSSVTPDLPGISDAIHRLWLDVSRFGPPELPSLPDIHIPGLGRYEVPLPPPPPPPPVPKTWYEDAADWASNNKPLVGGICVGTVGLGLLLGYGVSSFSGRRHRSSTIRPSATPSRRQVVVVLGGDTPLGFPLIRTLEQDGFIVIASVSTPEAGNELERRGNGFVRALVYNPQEPSMMTYFLRSLQATLFLRFPTNVAGDPYTSASSTTGTYIHSIISLLTLPSPSSFVVPTPFEHLPLTATYTPYLMQTHISPLQAIQAMLPLFRASHVHARDANGRAGSSRSIVVCVPATDARVGVPFSAAHAMSAAATVRGAEVLRREIRAATASDVGFESMRDLRVVIVDVGSVGSGQGESEPYNVDNITTSMQEWTSSERAVYSNAFTYVVEHVQGHTPKRKPASVDIFVNAMISVVGGSDIRSQQRSSIVVGFGVWRNKLRNWLRGERFAVGAGAHTYTFASYIPRIILDGLLYLPSYLVSIRNRYLPMPSRPAQRPTSRLLPRPVSKPPSPADSIISEMHGPPDIQDVADVTSSGLIPEAEGNSDAELESNAGASYSGSVSGVESSWVSLQQGE
ncbi:hypothetical protein BD410DRAFT_766704 [Rickenella mellea]|uniref:DUF1776-domain-containing protein n=1 Tax=Rickenella mellea TaxID=50990 RepID=A0A4Y7QCD0_9AGAM|nr:hypothetical protein BD410DRAFT_766704 [Rickenella mellea]